MRPWLLGLILLGALGFGSGFQGLPFMGRLRQATSRGGVSRGSFSRARVGLGLRMITPPKLPGQGTFEEAEEVAERLFRQLKKDEDPNGQRQEDDEWGRSFYEVTLRKPLGLTLIEVPKFGVYVQAVTEGTAMAAGVRRGDRIAATSSTVGGQMWDKNSLEGVLAAVQSGTLLGKSMRFRLERDAILSSIVGYASDGGSELSRVDLQRALQSVERARIRVQDTAKETFELVLPIPGREMRKLLQGGIFNGDMPYGLHLVQFPDEKTGTRVEVFDIAEGGTAAQSGILRKGDRIIAAQSSVGDTMWPKRTIEGVESAVRSRVGNSVKIRFERTVDLGAWAQDSSDVLEAGPEDMAGYFNTGGAAVGMSRRRSGSVGAGLNSSTLATSLSILPSKESWAVIQDIRRIHDRQAKLWPPHMSLIKPFVRGEAFLQASEMLHEALQKTSPFRIKMHLETYEHHARCITVWLVPDQESVPEVERLQRLCRQVFPTCCKTPFYLDFTPHLTLGQFESMKDARTFMALMQERFEKFEISVNHVYLLSRPDKGSQSVQQVRVLLGRKTKSLAQAFKEYSDLRRVGADLNGSTTRSVLLERCSFDVMAMGRSRDLDAIVSLVREVEVACIEIDTKFLNLLMMALLNCDRPDLAVEYFQDLTQHRLADDGQWIDLSGTARQDQMQRSEQSGVKAADKAAARHEGQAASGATEESSALAEEGTTLHVGIQAPPVKPNVMCFTTLIKALGRAGRVEEAFSLVGFMVRNAHPPNIRTINTLLEACVRNGELERAQRLFSSLRGGDKDDGGYVQLVTPATDAGVTIALKPSEVSFNIMVNGYAKHKEPDRAFKMLLEMRKARCKPDRITYTTLVKACVKAGQMERAENLVEQMRELDIPPDRFCYNLVMGGYARLLKWQKTLDVLKQMEDDRVQPDMYSYSFAISACVRAGKVKNAERAMRTMQENGIVPNVEVYSTLMAGYGDQGMFYEAQELMKEMQKMRIKANAYTYTSLTEAFINAGMADEALQMHVKMKKAGWADDIVVKTLLLRIFAMQGEFEKAFNTLGKIEELPPTNARTRPIPYNGIIKSAGQAGSVSNMLKAFDLMLERGVSPNRKTYEFLCCEATLKGYARVDLFLDIKRKVLEAGLKPLGPLYLELIRSSLKADDAQTAAKQVKERGDGLFTLSRLDAQEAMALEQRVANLMRMDVKGSWFDDSVGKSRNSGSLGWDDYGGVEDDYASWQAPKKGYLDAERW